MEIFLIIALIVVVITICVINSKTNNNDELKILKMQMATNKIRILQDKIRSLEYENNILKNYKSFFETSYKAASHKYDSNVKEAVKYAMKKAHPDNGGNNEEFNKFRELYNKIK